MRGDLYCYIYLVSYLRFNVSSFKLFNKIKTHFKTISKLDKKKKFPSNFSVNQISTLKPPGK